MSERPPRILLVEDEEALAESVRYSLEREGFEVVLAADGRRAIEKFRSMDDVLKFWNSPEYQEAKKLRAGLAQINFIVAIDGR